MRNLEQLFLEHKLTSGEENKKRETSRDRPKSALYPRLKNSKRTSKSQLTVLENRKNKKNGPSGAPGPLARAPGALKRKNFQKKNLTMPKKTERGGPFGIFQHLFCRKTAKKLKGGAFGKLLFPKKVSQCRKKLKGGLARYGMLRGKQEKPFCFSSLDQIVQFGAIIFCRTFKNYFGQFVWIEKKSL